MCICMKPIFYISQDSMDNKFSSKNKHLRRCFLCSSKNNIRGVTHSLHKKLFTQFQKVVPLGAGIFTLACNFSDSFLNRGL